MQHLAVLQVNLRARQNSNRAIQEVMMNLSPVYEQWLQETLAEGERRGRQEGRQEGERSLILRLLHRRVGELSADLRLQIEALSLEQLEQLGEALLDFTAIADLMAWFGEEGTRFL
jgi:predicted transposase YdaD